MRTGVKRQQDWREGYRTGRTRGGPGGTKSKLAEAQASPWRTGVECGDPRVSRGILAFDFSFQWSWFRALRTQGRPGASDSIEPGSPCGFVQTPASVRRVVQ